MQKADGGWRRQTDAPRDRSIYLDTIRPPGNRGTSATTPMQAWWPVQPALASVAIRSSVASGRTAPYLCRDRQSRAGSGLRGQRLGLGGVCARVAGVVCARAPSLISVHAPELRSGGMMVDGVSPGE